MSAVIVSNNKGAECPICLQAFGEKEEKVTHVGGEKHAGFHRPCLAQWVRQQATCPLDRMPIGADCLKSRCEKIMERVRPLMTKAVYGVGGACLGAAVGIASDIMAVGGIVLPVRIEAEVVRQVGLVIGGQESMQAQLVLLSGTAGIFAGNLIGTVTAASIIANGITSLRGIIGRKATAAAAVIGAAAIGGPLSPVIGSLAMGAIAGGWVAVSGLGTVGNIMGFNWATSRGMDWVLDRIGADQIAEESCLLGLRIGKIGGPLALAASWWGTEVPPVAFILALAKTALWRLGY